jgi:hypothetical protein
MIVTWNGARKPVYINFAGNSPALSLDEVKALAGYSDLAACTHDPARDLGFIVGDRKTARWRSKLSEATLA